MTEEEVEVAEETVDEAAEGDAAGVDEARILPASKGSVIHLKELFFASRNWRQ